MRITVYDVLDYLAAGMDYQEILAAVTHLCFNLFPRAWIGFALIHIPSLLI
jgi:hypothetical protein